MNDGHEILDWELLMAPIELLTYGACTDSSSQAVLYELLLRFRVKLWSCC